MTNRLTEVLQIPDDTILLKLLTDRINDEFNKQVSNIYDDKPGEISLEVKNSRVQIMLQDDEIKEMNGSLNLKTEAIYIDDPFIIDRGVQNTPIFMDMNRQPTEHRSNLRNKLFRRNNNSNVVDEIINTDKFKAIFEQVGLNQEKNILSIGARRYDFTMVEEVGGEKSLKVENLSTGIKTFLILKTLIINQEIQQNGTIILDEPEIHLHPEWQLLFAELLVLIQKEFNLHILINTHSPYFLRAIQVYSAKYGLADKCKYYLSYLDGEKAFIKDVSDNIEPLYKKLADPFQKLDDARWDND